MKTKSIMIVISILLLGSMVTGCSAKSGKNSYIEADIINGDLTLHKVKYYDFNKMKLITSAATENVHPGSLNSTQLSFCDKKGNLRIARINKKLTTRPSKVNIYLSRNKSKYDTYACKY